jgi:hypothetical protein
MPSQAPNRLTRIGYLSVGPPESQAEYVDTFLARMHDLGYVENKTFGHRASRRLYNRSWLHDAVEPGSGPSFI